MTTAPSSTLANAAPSASKDQAGGNKGHGIDAASYAFADHLLDALSAIRRNARRHAERPAELGRLSGAQLELVRLLRRRPGISVAEAAAELHVAPNTVSTLVRQLTDAGLVRRRVDASDHRVAQLDLTPEIRRKVDAFRDRRVLAVAGAARQLTAKDRQQLLPALDALSTLANRLESKPSSQTKTRPTAGEAST